MDPKIQQMQRDLEKFRAARTASTAPSSSPVVAPTAPATSSSTTSKTKIQQDLERIRANRAAGISNTKPGEKKESVVGNMAKSLLTAPATIAARPFQLAAEAVLPGDNTEALDRFSREKLGGLVAPVPQSGADVKKDTGRAIQTVALGTGAPIAGGAAFGLGSSLEQGNDLWSLDTAFNTATGGAVGKASVLIGKPLLNAAGKTIGVITPQYLKNVASKGNAAIQQFMKDNQLMNAVTAPVKPLAGAIEKSFQAVDDKIVDTTKNLFQGGKGKVGNAIKTQYPGLSDENLQKRFTRIEQESFSKPATIPKSAYGKATEISRNAKTKGHDVSKTLVDNGIRHDEVIEDGVYNTFDRAEAFQKEAIEASNQTIRPSLVEADYSFTRVPISKVRENMLAQIEKIPKRDLNATDKKKMQDFIMKRYADDSAEALAHPNGYGLEDFHDNKIETSVRGQYNPNGSSSDAFDATIAREESRAFKELLENSAPSELDVKRFNEEIQKQFEAANYLKALHSKKVPTTLFQKGVDLVSKVTGATIGSGFAGGYGSIVGYHAGPVLLNSFKYLPNPVKAKYLQSVARENPAIFKEFQDFLGMKEVEKLMQLKLPAPGQTSYKETGNTLFATPKGKITPIKQEAVDITSTEGKKVKQPKQGKSDRKNLKAMLEGFEEYKKPGTIKSGRTPNKNKRLRELYGDLPSINF